MRASWRENVLRTIATASLVASLTVGCQGQKSEFELISADRLVSGKSKYPLAINVQKVGTYPALTKSGAGYFFDDVLEYRVWLHPERGATPLNGSNDYYYAFAEYERAEAFSRTTTGAEHPLVLVRQLEYIDEPTPGHYQVVRSERMTEWQIEWLAEDKRGPNSIDEFLKSPRPQKAARDADDDSDDDSN